MLHSNQARHIMHHTDGAMPHAGSRSWHLRQRGGPMLSVESVKGSIAKSAEAWRLYRSQAVFPAALALALLYLTVMNFVSLLCLSQL